MAKFNGQPQHGNGDQFERVLFPADVYQGCRLTKVFLKKTAPTSFAPDGSVKAFFIFGVPDADGLEFETMSSANFPKGFAYNSKSGFWKFVEKLVGTSITGENSAGLECDFDSDAKDLTALFKECNELTDKGKTPLININSLTWEGKELLDQKFTLVLSIWTSENGKQGNNIDGVIPASSNPKPSFGKPRPAAVAPTMPPARAASAVPAGMP